MDLAASADDLATGYPIQATRTTAKPERPLGQSEQEVHSSARLIPPFRQGR